MEVHAKLLEKWNEYKIWRCPECELAFADPRKNPGNEWYEEQDLYNIPSHFRGKDLLGWHHKQFLLRCPEPKGRLLDIGCGTGIFLTEVQRRGFEVAGVDFNVDSIKKAKNVYGLTDVHAQSFEDFSKGRERSFQVITFFEVLEHQEEPEVFIQHVTRLLSPGGTICLSVPNDERTPRFFIEGDYPPHHFTRWRKSTLTKFLNRHGFDVERIVESGPQIHMWLGNTIRLGIGKGFLRRGRSSENGSQQERRSLEIAGRLHYWKSLLLWYIGIPMDFILKLLGAKGFQLVVFARKRT